MKNGQPHELPLARHALALIAARKAAKVEGGDLVFPSGPCLQPAWADRM
jgi:hypothetical protein